MASYAVDIAGVHLRFHTGNTRAHTLLAARFGAFADDAVDECIDIELDLWGEELQPGVDGAVLASWRLPSGDIRVEGEDTLAHVAANNRHAYLRGPLAGQSLDAVVRLVLARALLERGELLIHASAVVIDGRASIFAGPSGAGKSTIAATLDGAVLSDEHVALTRVQGTWSAAATPYWNGRRGAAPLSGIYFLARGTTARWQPLSRAQAAARLFVAAGPLPAGGEASALAIASRIAEAAPRCAAIELATLHDIRHWLAPRLASRGTERR